jgi:hypothetical protein
MCRDLVQPDRHQPLQNLEMTTDRVEALQALLVETEAAHGAYEASELNGVYDEQWPSWYAEYAVEHGIGTILGRPVTADQLARSLKATWDDLQRADPKPAEPWSSVIARHLATVL